MQRTKKSLWVGGNKIYSPVNMQQTCSGNRCTSTVKCTTQIMCALVVTTFHSSEITYVTFWSIISTVTCTVRSTMVRSLHCMWYLPVSFEDLPLDSRLTLSPPPTSALSPRETATMLLTERAKLYLHQLSSAEVKKFEKHAAVWFVPVSYTHLTLPTIYSV